VLDVRWRVHERQLVLARRPGREPPHAPSRAGAAHVLEKHPETVGTLGMSASRIVREHARIEDDGGGHRSRRYQTRIAA
jgi:hypothetical protein